MKQLVKYATMCRDLDGDMAWKGVEWTVKDGMLVIKGSNETRDWFRNFNIATASGMHAGFWKAAHKIIESERRVFDVVIGHSQGGGIASIISHLTGKPAVTFGAPKVALNGHDFWGDVTRVVNRNDLVARLPLVGDWEHIGRLVYIGFDGKLHDTIQKKDWLIGRWKAWSQGEWFDGVKDHAIDKYVRNLAQIL